MPRKSSSILYFLVLASILLLVGFWSVDSSRHLFLKMFGITQKSQETGSAGSGHLNESGRERKPRPASKKSKSYETLPYSEIELLENGKISERAAKSLKLSESERVQTQMILENHFKALGDLIRPTIVTTENGSSTIFRIPALAGRGKPQIDAFVHDLSLVLQHERTEKLLEMLPLPLYFGGFGQFDSALEVTPKENFSQELRPKTDWVKIIYTDPVTGEVSATISTATESGFGFFPGLFEDSSRDTRGN